MTFDELFEMWQAKHSFEAFIKDGIVNIDTYEKPHILFILRDMNWPKTDDLCRHLHEHGSGHKTWNNIARWTIALLDGEEEYPQEMPQQFRAKQLSRVAAINLKKEGGTSRADGKELLNFATEQREMILDEIKLCNPDIIICCGQSMTTAPSNAVILEKNILCITAKWESFHSSALPREWWYFKTNINGKTIPIISFCHPQATNLCGKRGHKDLFEPLYRDMLIIRKNILGLC